jgi:hypothetical protein
MEIDGKRLAAALGLAEPPVVHTELCRSQIAAFEAGLAPGAAVHVACTQEAPLFREVAAEKGEAELTFTNIRERAGWCADKSAALPKMAALLAEAAHTSRPTGVTTLKSEGVCLVYGRGQAALDVAAELSERLSVTVLLSDPEEALPPGIASVPIYKGRIRTATGHLGRFEIEVDGYAPMLPSSKGALQFVMPRDGARSTCDIIFDMSGGPLFADAQRRDGYLHIDRTTRPPWPRHVQGHRPRRRVREAALCQLRRRHLRARAQPEGRLQQLPRQLPDGGHQPQWRSCRYRSGAVRRLRQLQRGVPDGSG